MKTENDSYVLFSIFLSVFLFLSVTQTLTSGFHFVDDHEIIRIKYDLKENNLLKVMGSWIHYDMNSNDRFRPLYIVNRVFMTWIYGSDFFFLSLYNGLLWCLTLVFFYIGIRNLVFNIFESVIFLLISFIGPHSEIWWRLGPQESLGITFISIAFLFMSLSVRGKRSLLNNTLFILFIILASLCKESFILTIPAFIFLRLSLERTLQMKDTKELLIKNLILIIPLIIGLLELLFIKYRIGTSYSGINGESGAIFGNIVHTSLRYIKTYLNIIIAGVILLIAGIVIKKRIFWFDLTGFVFFLLIFVPNVMLYANTGLVDRYLIPSSIGLAYFLVLCLKDVADNSLWYRKATYIVLMLSFLPHLINAINTASDFAIDGRETKDLLAAISSGYEKDGKVMAVVDPVESYEKSVSLKTFLHYENDIDLYGYNVLQKNDDQGKQEYIDGWKSYFAGKLYENLTSDPQLLVFLDSKQTEIFFQTGPLSIVDYEPVESGSYTYSVYRRISK